MSELVITGGRPLSGEICVQGSKNSALPILAATLVTQGKTTLFNCPHLKDVDSAIEILTYLGCKVERDDDCICVDTSKLSKFDIPDTLMREMRSSVIFLGAILARLKKAALYMPGGCELGPRPIDLHLSALKLMGVKLIENSGQIVCDGESLKSADIQLAFPSVGATENIMLASCGCKGKMRIYNAAREPEIMDLQNYLNRLGYHIYGAGESVITIDGADGISRKDVTHRIMPDRIVAGTYLCAAAITGGDVRVNNVCPEHFLTLTEKLRETGCEIISANDSVRLRSNGKLTQISPVQTMPYPGFATDLQSPLMAVCCYCEGTSVFVENIFDNRYRHVSELVRMGADIKIIGKVAIVNGSKTITGTNLYATDLRGGVAIVIAALGAKGMSRVCEIGHIDRGYERIEAIIQSLGGDILRI